MSEEKMTKRKDKNIAEGEVTGHAHRCTAEDVEVYESESGVRILHCPNGTTVTHEEHGAGFVPPLENGEPYYCGPQQETDPISKRIEAVRD